MRPPHHRSARLRRRDPERASHPASDGDLPIPAGDGAGPVCGLFAFESLAIRGARRDAHRDFEGGGAAAAVYLLAISSLLTFGGGAATAGGAAADARTGILKEKRQLIGPLGSPEQIARDPFAIVDKVPLAEMPMIYIACGGQDVLLQDSRTFVDLLSKKKIPYEYREISPGDHNYDFWDQQISVFLELLMEKPGFTQ